MLMCFLDDSVGSKKQVLLTVMKLYCYGKSFELRGKFEKK
jgi:hypothetical protein